MKYSQLLILVGIFLMAILIHWFMIQKEYFFVQTQTPLTKENVQELFDSFILDTLSYYQKLKKDSVNLSDPRIKSRIVTMGNAINGLNAQYPAFQYTIQTFDYTKTSMIRLEDLSLVKSFLLSKVGINPNSNLTAPADIADLDLLTNRILSITGIIQQKSVMVQGGAQLLSPMNKNVRKILENVTKLKKDLANRKPQDIPILKNDLYLTILQSASVNFLDDSSLDLSKEPILQLDNLPFTKPPSIVFPTIPPPALVTPASVPPVIPVAPTAPVAPTPVPTTPTAPTPVPTTSTVLTSSTTKPSPTGMRFSELIQTLLSYSPLNEAKNNNSLLSTQYTGSNASILPKKYVGSNVESNPHANSILYDEIDSELKNVKKGPKDTYNSKIASRCTNPVKSCSCSTNTDSLEQGAWFRNTNDACPYAQSQQSEQIDMSQYIRKDSIPCYGCTLK